MDYTVIFTAYAKMDLRSSLAYYLRKDLPDIADRLLTQLENASQSLAQYPERGHIPPETVCAPLLDCKEILSPPFRILYKIRHVPRKVVLIYAILDSRRSIAEILQQRILP